MNRPRAPLTYSNYLHLDRLLELQEPASQPPEHDEMLFIVIHQVYELWFKLLLHEFEKIKGDFERSDLFAAIATFKRVRTVMKTLVGQLDILETMTPMSFTSFRDRLETASGFQSVQFRELEFLLGYKRPELLRYLPAGAHRRDRLERRLEEPSVVDYFLRFLAASGATIPRDVLEREVRSPYQADRRVQEQILALYRAHPEMTILFELMTDYDEGQQEWRYRHIKLAERTIGNKKGTGGSPGVEFLKATLFCPVFADLWAIRHEL